jgi:hypothetical protein
VVILAVAGLCGCSKASAAPKVPYVPPEYFNCTEVTPKILCDAYFSRYANVSIASLQFNGLYFVFKNLLVTDLMLKTVDKGYILAGNLIECDCVNISVMKQYTAGDKIDVVGKDQGVTMGVPGGLQFVECIILPPGSVQLPSPGSGVLVPQY